ncbi:ribosomal protein S18 acetylase RimI-like enzyme [Bacillus oleivorans]|uniref:Ribosomal protein S18 acetylase RimI-like enzyme n=1 Tax=Bacillus oleivorans TaxID=1448271 RepID=A0A285D4U3_9BACI|nr:GNAT family N-acetyltransferase [Bacillus oleivorans]SNX74824.1 ribosomal protein S18 acetylase RimI-like enzyme [Bacillus oleivorans]
MEIRRLTPFDAEIYREIRLEALKLNAEAYSTRYEDEIERPIKIYQERFRSNYSFTLGAFESEKLIGTVTVIREQHLKLHHRVNIVAMYVKPHVRGLGIGKALMNEAIQRAREWEGVEQIHLTVVSSNESARKLYSALGFQVYGTEKQAMKLGDTYWDEERMVLFL